ncbi:MAG TPA: RNA methyltransferase [Bacillota bacterium]|nr:RNA methyltransferase [Bacillota bacterium]
MHLITSRSNEKIRKYRALVSKPEEGFVTLEGIRLIRDCFDAGASFSELFISERCRRNRDSIELAEKARATGAEIVDVTDDILDYMADTQHPGGMAAIAIWNAAEDISPDLPVIALDDLQDPGNLGAIIRSAAAFGYGAVLLGGKTAKANSPKVARASMGAIYRINILHVKNLAAALAGLKECGFKVHGLDMEGAPIEDLRAVVPYCMVVGSEGSGLSNDVRALLDSTVSIRMAGGVESLNASVAASIAMWSASRH